MEAQQLSSSAGDVSFAAVWEADIASLYSDIGELDAAADWIERSLRRMTGADRARHLPQLQLQLATIRARQSRMPEALALFSQGIDGADRAGDLNLYAIGWNRLGEAWLAEGDLPQAERALLEAYRNRKLYHLALDTSYRSLGRLRMAQGDLPAASALLDRAVDLAAHPQGLMPTWDIYHSRGLVRLAQGRLREALNDLRIAVRLGRAWRWSAPADDSARIGAETMLDQMHSDLIEAGNRLYLETHDPTLLSETFVTAEENRSASLSALLHDPKSATPDLPPTYWDALGRLQKAELAALRTGNTAGLDSARAGVVRLEASFEGRQEAMPARLVDETRAALAPGQVLFSFHLGARGSWLWALDRAGLELYSLSPRAAIVSQIRAALPAIRESRPGADALSAALYRTLFGSVPPRFREAPNWLLELDDALFEVPFATLIENSGSRPLYLLEHHTLERVPGVSYWLEAVNKGQPQISPLFLGVGDPIYNRADDRLSGTPAAIGNALPLPRLVGSGPEIEACARAWSGPAVLLRGSDVSREKLAAQLGRRPAVVHLAAHYLQSAARYRDGLIALSLSPSGSTELLTAFEISRWRLETGLVVLSGCHSAVGAALPGTGVLGLTRAWLAAGAQAVVASLWDVPDDEGTLFEPLYRTLHSSPRLDAPRALREAQLLMLHTGGRMARPDYWGAYFIVGNPGKIIRP